MNLLAVTCYTGDDYQMTQRMIDGLRNSEFDGNLTVSVIAQGADKLVEADVVVRRAKNQGFAVGMNSALFHGALDGNPDAVLCINNDVEFPVEMWLNELVENLSHDRVIVPTTSYTAAKEQERSAYEDAEPFDHGDTPAVCWLMSWPVCVKLFTYTGSYRLFREDFGMAWGEDSYSAAVFRRVLHSKPFLIVPRAFIHHLGARTSSKIPASARMAAVAKSREAVKKDLG